MWKVLLCCLLFTTSLKGADMLEQNSYQGRRIEARSVPVDCDGKTLQRDLVTHPGAVVVLPVLDDGRVVLIRNHRFAVGETLWEAPAGTLEAGEEPLEAAKRELEEETGYCARSVKPLFQCYASPGYCNELFHIFLAKDLQKKEQMLEEGEEITVHVLDLGEVEALLRRGEIRDAKTLVAVQGYLASIPF